MNKGFTLIELLVVVLIIGILAAIALPQYQKAVERSRMAEAIQYLGDYANAQSIYYMQHNAFAEDMDELNGGDITLSEPGDAFDYDAGRDRLLGKLGDPPNFIAYMTAERQSGIYEGCQLRVDVEVNGSISKTCIATSAKSAFCTMAEAAGYQPFISDGLIVPPNPGAENNDDDAEELEDCEGMEWEYDEVPAHCR